jgi:hypothetical protein
MMIFIVYIGKYVYGCTQCKETNTVSLIVIW